MPLLRGRGASGFPLRARSSCDSRGTSCRCILLRDGELANVRDRETRRRVERGVGFGRNAIADVASHRARRHQ
jgi:hypothetical protein